MRYYVYVFELVRSRCIRSCRSKARCREKSKRSECLYVGSSVLTPSERVRHQKSRISRTSFRRLRRDLSPRGSFSTRSAAEKFERQLAWKLRREGYTVFQA